MEDILKPSVIEGIESVGYTPLKLLGKGTYGKVIKVKSNASDLEEDEIYAMKLMKYKVTEKGEVEDYSAFTEAYFTRFFKHPNVIRRNEFNYIGDNYTYFNMELADGTLEDVIPNLTKDEMYQYAHEIADAIHYIHRGGFAHCDIKPVNVLLVNGQIKLADLGFIRIKENTLNDFFSETICQTVNYRPPEQYTINEKYLEPYTNLVINKFKSTIKEISSNIFTGEYWSLGILILDMLYGISFVTVHGTEKYKYGYYNFLKDLAKITIEEDDLELYDIIIDMYGAPKDIPLLQAVCQHLLALDPRKRSIVNFLEDPVFLPYGYTHSKIPFIYPSTNKMYKGNVNELYYHQIAINWLIELTKDLKCPLFTTMNAIDFYLQHCHKYVRESYQLLIVVTVFLIERILVPTDVNISIDSLVYMTDDSFTKDQFREMVRKIETEYDGYPVFESLYFYLPSLQLVEKGFRRMVDIKEYISYGSPRNIADQLIAEETEDELKHRIPRQHIKSYDPHDEKDLMYRSFAIKQMISGDMGGRSKEAFSDDDENDKYVINNIPSDGEEEEE